MSTNGQAMSHEQMLARIAELEAKVANTNKQGIRVSEKKALSVYGIQRFPVTLYAQGWIELAKRIPDILAFIEANKTNLSWKE